MCVSSADSGKAPISIARHRFPLSIALLIDLTREKELVARKSPIATANHQCSVLPSVATARDMGSTFRPVNLVRRSDGSK